MQFLEKVREVFHLAMRVLFLHVGESPVPDFPQDHLMPGGHMSKHGTRDEAMGLNKTSKPFWLKVVVVVLVVVGVLWAVKVKAQTTTQARNDVTVAALSARLEKAEAAASALSAQLARTKALLEARQPDNPAMPSPILFESAPACLAEVAQYLSSKDAAKFCLDSRRIERNRAETAAKAQRPVIVGYDGYGGSDYGRNVSNAPAGRNVVFGSSGRRW